MCADRHGNDEHLGPVTPTAGKLLPGHMVAADRGRSRRRKAGARICEWVIPMALSRQQIATVLRRAGLEDAAAEALADLTDPVDVRSAERFCAAHGLSVGSLMDRMGSSS